MYVFAVPVCVLVVGITSLALDTLALPITYGVFDEPFCVTRGLIELGRSLTEDRRRTP